VVSFWKSGVNSILRFLSLLITISHLSAILRSGFDQMQGLSNDQRRIGQKSTNDKKELVKVGNGCLRKPM
jgi:hypothetical protein